MADALSSELESIEVVSVDNPFAQLRKALAGVFVRGDLIGSDQNMARLRLSHDGGV